MNKDFENYKLKLTKLIFKYDICYNHSNLMNMFSYQRCKIPVCGYPDILYLVSTAPNKQYLLARIKNYKGCSRFIERFWKKGK